MRNIIRPGNDDTRVSLHSIMLSSLFAAAAAENGVTGTPSSVMRALSIMCAAVSEAKVDLEAETKNRTHLFYREPEYAARSCNVVPKGRGFLNIKPAMKDIVSWLLAIGDISILEVGAGSGYSSELLRRALIASGKKIKYVATDLYKHPHRYFAGMDTGLASEVAVRRYYHRFNVLVIIAPPPNTVYLDYYAIKELEILHDRASDNRPCPMAESGRYTRGPRYLLYVGEIGYSDGGKGMHHYMLSSESRWKLVANTMLPSMMVDIFGESERKGVYLFRLI